MDNNIRGDYIAKPVASEVASVPGEVIEYETAEQMQPPSMKMLLPRFDASEFQNLVLWANLKKETWPFFASWLDELLMAELQRRFDPSMEAGSLRLPPMNGSELGECLCACYVLRNTLPMSVNQAAFVDELMTHIVSHAASVLDIVVGSNPA